jgi:GNAT superfamily N-acetyltransferase
MSASQIILKQEPPSASDFELIRSAVGWKNPKLPIIQSSIDSSLFWVSGYLGNLLVGCGRVIGDGSMYFYIQDVIVHPKHQNLGLGSQIMQSINQYIAASCPAGSTVGLLAAKGKEAFYLKYGFEPRNGEDLGMGMCRFI